ncbi:MAG TPA: hypothetical protein VIN59_02890 [Alphaproteobacteria bacterium]
MSASDQNPDSGDKKSTQSTFQSAANNDDMTPGQKFWQAARPVIAVGVGLIAILAAGSAAGRGGPKIR